MKEMDRKAAYPERGDCFHLLNWRIFLKRETETRIENELSRNLSSMPEKSLLKEIFSNLLDK